MLQLAPVVEGFKTGVGSEVLFLVEPFATCETSNCLMVSQAGTDHTSTGMDRKVISRRYSE